MFLLWMQHGTLPTGNWWALDASLALTLMEIQEEVQDLITPRNASGG